MLLALGVVALLLYAVVQAPITSASKALGTIAMERLLDGAVLLVLIDALGLLLFRQRMPSFSFSVAACQR